MAAATEPFLLKNTILTLTVEGGSEAPYQCQLSQAELTPTAGTGGGNTLTTFCDTFSEPPGASTWVLTLAGFQSWADVADLSRVLFENEGETIAYSLAPYGGTVGPAAPAFEGEIIATPVSIGGTAGQYAVFSTTQVCKAKPVMVTA